MKTRSTLRTQQKIAYPKAFVQQYQGRFSDNRLQEYLYKKEAKRIFKWLTHLLEQFPHLSPSQADYALTIAKYILKYDTIKRTQSAELVGEFLTTVYPLFYAKFEKGNGRFGNHITDSKQRIRIRLIWVWFKCWIIHSKPKFQFFKNGSYNYWNGLKEYSFEQIIQYLPSFIWIDIAQKNPIIPSELIIHLAKGCNIRGLWHTISKKMAHTFINFSVEEYLYFLVNRRNQANVISNMLFYSFLKSKGQSVDFHKWITTHFAIGNDVNAAIKKWKPYIEKLIQWNFILLQRDKKQELLGYIAHGVADIENFTLRGRTLKSTQRLAAAYYADMERQALAEQHARRVAYEQLTWEGASYQEWNLLEKNSWYAIFQLNNQLALDEESRTMAHCVRSYTHDCINGACSIWSLRMQQEDLTWQPLVTIEVNQKHEIVQAKMKYNALATNDLLDKILDWANQEGLTYVES